MALSEFEKLELGIIAQGLEEDDPKLAALMSLEDLNRRRRKRTQRGIITAFSGLGLLLAGFLLANVALGVLGFLLMGGGTYWATLFIGATCFGWRPRSRTKHHETNKEQS